MQINRTFGNAAGRVRVLSASWRGTAESQALAEAVAAADAEDMLLVAAAGNDSVDIDATPVYPAGLAAANVVAVAATNGSDLPEVYRTSARFPLIWRRLEPRTRPRWAVAT